MNISLFLTNFSAPTLGTIVSVIILVCLAAALAFYYYKTKPSDYQKSKAYDFLFSLKEQLEDSISGIIASTDTIHFEDFAEYQAKILSDVYDKAWELVTEEILVTIEDPILKKAMIKILNKDAIITFVDDLIAEQNLLACLENIFDGSITSDFEVQAMKDDEEAAEIAAAYEEGRVEVDVPEDVDLDKTEFEKGREEHPEAELPEEETPYSEDDATMEILQGR